MKSELIKFPVRSFRKIVDPEVSIKNGNSGSDGASMYVAIVDIRELPGEFESWRGINPRDPNINSSVSKKIWGTLDESPESFLLRNRGLAILAHKVDFNNQTNQVALEMSNPQLHGLLDGGHTYKVIREFITSLPDEDKRELFALVKLELIEGIQDRDVAVNIVAARNISAQVKEQSLENLRGHFDQIREVLKGKPYLENISFKETEYDEEGDRKSVDIRDILSYLICFDVENFSNENHPIVAYSQKNQVVQLFGDKQRRESLLKYIPLLPVILELHDQIYLKLPDAYNHKTGGKFGNITGIKFTGNNPRMSDVALRFDGGKSEYRIPSSFIYPVLAAFRSAIEIKNDQALWKADPLRLLDDLIEDLAQQIGKQAIEFRNPTKLGKDSATWNLCYYVVERALLLRNIK